MAEQRKTRALISTQRLDESPERKRGIAEQVEYLIPLWRESTEAAAALDRWYYNQLEEKDYPKLPKKAGQSIKDLKESSPTGWAKMIADSMTQNLIVDGIRQRSNGDAAPATRLWQQNGLDARQRPVHDGIIRHGKAFNLVGKAVGRLDGKPTAFIRGKSALTCDAFFRDDFDEYPEFFLEGHVQVDDDGERLYRWDFYDDVAHHWLTSKLDGSGVEYIAYEPHEMDITPVVRGYGNLDLTGRTIGEIEPYITLFKRINQSTMDRLVVQRFGAFVIRWLAGMVAPGATEEDKRAAAVALSMTDLLMLENPQGKAGALPATPLDGYIKSREADIRDLSAVSQTPSFHMLGLSDNVGAEGLAAATAAHMQKNEVWKVALGEFWETSTRLAGHAAGDREIAEDFESRVHWKDTKVESFQSLAQGLGALATQLGIPGEVLWPYTKIMEQPDIEQARRLAEKAKAEAQMEADLEADRQIRAQTAVASARGNAGTAR